MSLTTAQQAQVDALKPLLGDTTLSDQNLWDIIALNNESANCSAAYIWGTKAADSAGLINIREGSSTRNLSDVQTNALKMSKHYDELCQREKVEATTSRGARTRPIERP